MKYRNEFLNVIEYVTGDMPEKNSPGTLYIADASLCQSGVLDQSIPFAVYCDTGKYPSSFFDGAKFVLEGDGPFDPGEFGREYLERIYRRLNKLPWFILETERCVVRETCLDDLDAFYEIYSDQGMTEYIEPLMERTEEEKYTENYRECIYEIYGHGIWTVILKETGEVIGRAGLDARAGFDTPELGFMIGKKWQGKGLAFEVCSQILNWGASEGITEVMSLVNPNNEASVNLLSKLGFAPSEDIVINSENLTKYARISTK